MYVQLIAYGCEITCFSKCLLPLHGDRPWLEYGENVQIEEGKRKTKQNLAVTISLIIFARNLKTPMPRKPAIAVMLASQESMLCIFKSRLATVQDLTFWQRICWRTSNTNIIFKRRAKRGVLQSLDFCEMLYVLKVENVRHSVFFRSVFAEFWKNVFKWRCCVGKRYVSFFFF